MTSLARSRAPWALAHGLLIVAFLFLVPYLSRGIWNHVRELWSHLRSGTWEISSDEKVLDARIREKYQGSAWAVHYVAGTAQRFPLDPASRQETLEILGRTLITESPQLRFRSVKLPGAYRAFLADSIRNLSQERQEGARGPLRMLSDLLSRPSGERNPEDLATTYRRASAVLAAMPGTSPLRQALQSFEEHGTGLGVDFPAYAVYTQPSYDLESAWSANAVALPQKLRCRGDVSPVGAESSPVMSNISVASRVLEIELVRDWISDSLLDAKAAAPATSASHFGEQGALRLIPDRLWALVGDQVTIAPTSPEMAEVIEKWARGNACCRVSCGEETLTLSPASLRAEKKGTYVGHVQDGEPILYAIVSRRRGIR